MNKNIFGVVLTLGVCCPVSMYASSLNGNADGTVSSRVEETASTAESVQVSKEEKDALFVLRSTAATESEGARISDEPVFRGSNPSHISDSEVVNLYIDARVDYQRDWSGSKTVKDNSGFEGKYIDLRLDGTIIPGLTYSWRQRFNKINKDTNFFDSTDWLWLNYDFKNWSFSAGKQVVMIGGFEYDRAPIDLYGCSVYWNNVPCYDLGVSVGYKVTPKDKLSFQVTQSPFYTTANRDMYAYNLMWNGNHGWYQSIWSANMIEYADGRYISYLTLGNKFSFGPVSLELDFMNRASSHQTYFFKDCSVMSELSYKPTSRWNIFAKYTYDVNKSGRAADLCVSNGTELNMIGGGVEFFPLLKKKTSLRLHANCFYSWGYNANPSNVMQNKTTILDFGVTWYMNVLKVKR